MSKGVFEVLSTGGDSALGGDDFDRLIYMWMIQETQLSGLETQDQRALLSAAKRAKEELSEVTEISIELS